MPSSAGLIFRLHPTGGWQPGPPRELAEVLVERQEDAVLTLRAGEDVVIGAPGRIGADRHDVVAGCPQWATASPGIFSSARSRTARGFSPG